MPVSTVKLSVIRALGDLERELRSAHRSSDADALREALAILARSSSRTWLTTGEASEQLDVSIPTVKDWIRRGTLQGRQVGSRWRVSNESVRHITNLRESIADVDEEGYPSEEEIRDLTFRIRRPGAKGDE